MASTRPRKLWHRSVRGAPSMPNRVLRNTAIREHHWRSDSVSHATRLESVVSVHAWEQRRRPSRHASPCRSTSSKGLPLGDLRRNHPQALQRAYRMQETELQISAISAVHQRWRVRSNRQQAGSKLNPGHILVFIHTSANITPLFGV